ncbi:MAG: hypothetical protein ACRC5C_07660 [Bacilli bacterium]
MNYALYFEHPAERSLAHQLCSDLNLPCFSLGENSLTFESGIEMNSIAALMHAIDLHFTVYFHIHSPHWIKGELFDDYTVENVETNFILQDVVCVSHSPLTDDESRMFFLQFEEYLVAHSDCMFIIPQHTAPLVAKYVHVYQLKDVGLHVIDDEKPCYFTVQDESFSIK